MRCNPRDHVADLVNPRLEQLRASRDAPVRGSSSPDQTLRQRALAATAATVEVDGSHATFLDDRRFYPAAALAALPRYLVWLCGAVATWRTHSDPPQFALVKGLSVRLGRALRARDYFNVRVRSPRPEDAWDEALFFFETALVSLNGALDAAARFCHLAYCLNAPVWSASWSRATWREELLGVAPELKELLDPSSGRLVQCRTLVSVLRNSIHGEALTEELHSGGAEGPRTMDYGLGAVAVASSDGRRLLTAAGSLGGADSWGLEERFNQDVLILPARFLQRVISTVLRVLDELMVASAPEVGPAADEPPLDRPIGFRTLDTSSRCGFLPG